MPTESENTAPGQTAAASEHLDHAAAARVYAFLARLWLKELDRPLLRDLARGPLADAYRAAGGQPPPDDTDETLERLAVDFCQLFIGPCSHLPPYQSVWQQGTFEGQPAASMDRFRQLAGELPDWVPPDIMSDHFGLQLQIMSMLLQLQPPHHNAGQPAPSYELAKTFFRTHLTWPDKFLTAAAERAQTPFYTSLANLTAQFLADQRRIWLDEQAASP